MKSAEVHQLEDTKLLDLIKDTRKELFGLRFQHATGELENTANMRAQKKALARALTIANQRGLDTSKA